MGRILLVTFQQALRSVALVLLPLSFIALFAWSTAGSATGNTSDPIRAAIWMWLGSHLVPFKLSLASGFSSGALSYLPIGAAILPWLAIRSGFRRASEFSSNPRGSRTFVVFFYTVIATLAAALSQSENIKPNLVLTPVFVLLLALSATINYQSNLFDRFKFIVYALISVLGLTTIAIGISLILHFEIVKSLAIVIQPGIMGGILFTILQLLYLPNFAIAGVSYFNILLQDHPACKHNFCKSSADNCPPCGILIDAFVVLHLSEIDCHLATILQSLLKSGEVPPVL